MINLHISQKQEELDLELHGADGLILNEISTAVIRILEAMEQHKGHPIKENLATLMLMLIEKSEENDNVRSKAKQVL